ncbi:hypothetical protein LAC02_49160 [Ligilactobacillus acidipiscis]|nr:hypothetical protein LAC02_49160 [Ligilactobacillus acidipiscis]
MLKDLFTVVVGPVEVVLAGSRAKKNSSISGTEKDLTHTNAILYLKKRYHLWYDKGVQRRFRRRCYGN